MFLFFFPCSLRGSYDIIVFMHVRLAGRQALSTLGGEFVLRMSSFSLCECQMGSAPSSHVGSSATAAAAAAHNGQTHLSHPGGLSLPSRTKT